MSELGSYVLLPSRGLRAPAKDVSTSNYLLSLQPALATPETEVNPELPNSVHVIDSIAENGAKLVEMNIETKRQLEIEQPGLRIEPVRYYDVARLERFKIVAAPPLMRVSASLHIPSVNVRIVDAATGKPVAGASVVAFTDFVNRFGASGQSSADGTLALNFGVANPRIERLYVYPPLSGYWGVFRQDLTADQIGTIGLSSIEPDSASTSLEVFIGRGSETDGSGVTIAVIDTGVGPHPLLDSISTGDLDNGEAHGTHVAGIIRMVGGGGVRIRSYRVFGRGALAANFGIAKAIDQAVADGCDLLNLSLKIAGETDAPGVQVDPVVAFALQDAWDAGCLPIAAAGNDGRQFVTFPAREPTCVAVSAAGRQGTYPSGSLEDGEALMDPTGKDPLDFVAGFSNIGPEVTVIAPGVGVVSTVPGGGWGVMSGTSMACPAVAGVAARLLANHLRVLQMSRDSNRTGAIRSLLLRTVRDLGFPRDYQGLGLPK